MNITDYAIIAQGAGSILMVFVTLIGFLFITRQVRQTKKSIEHSSNVAIYDISSEFYRFLAENSELRPYFYDNKEIRLDEECIDKLFSMCEYLADFFEFILIESKQLNPEIYQSWEEYINNVNLNSPVFRLYIDRYKNNYTTELIYKLNKGI